MRSLLLLVPSLLIGCEPGKISVGGDSGGTGTDPGDDTVVSGSISVSPSSLTFDTVFTGSSASREITIGNVGDGAVSIATEITGAQMSTYGITLDEAAPAPGESATLTLTLAPSSWGDHSVSLVITDAAGDGRVTVPVAAWVEEDSDGDGFGSAASGGEDCDDADPMINPGVDETWYDGVDQDCDGRNDFDQDADGATVDADCDDADSASYPGAPEVWYDGVDQDCAGDDDYDQDIDGFPYDVDCDDTDAAINPSTVETWYDGVDQNCDGRDDDQDGDGFTLAEDCDDTDAHVYPGADEVWYDGADGDCMGGDDFDQDGDGVAYPTDCSDTDPTTTGPTDEVWDGLDNDCDGAVDDLSIADLADGVLYGPTASLALGNRNGLSLGGDVTGDGHDDLVIASSSAGNGYGWVVAGSTAATASGSVESYDAASLVGETYYAIGQIVGPAQDVTGDGTADVLIDASGTYSSRYGSYYTGSAFARQGGSSLTGAITLSATYDARFEGDSDGDAMRWAVAGDIDGDGTADVVAGCPYDSYYSSSGWYAYYTGNVSVFAGGALDGAYTLDEANDQIHGADQYEYLGYTLAIGDLDGDGYADILAGAPGNGDVSDDAGAVYVFAGNASLQWSDDQADGAMAAEITGTSRDDELGVDPIASPGDVDGDGTLDLALTSSGDGLTYLFYDGSALSGTSGASSADLTISGSGLGTALTYNADLDGNGAADLVLGASGDDTAGTDAGAAYVFRPEGTTGTWTTANAVATIRGEAAGDALGAGLAGGGDADGDGIDDLLVGASGADGAATDGGAVYVVLGR